MAALAPNSTASRDLETLSPKDRAAAGKALRRRVPRERHREWKAARGRPNPIDVLKKQDAGRLKDLVPIRYGRMLESPFAFYRGTAALMAVDLSRLPTTGLRVHACGDCHLLNFGGFATPERNVIFDINDFDETLPAPWEWDVKRLAASIVLAGRSIGLADRRARACAVASVRSYRERLRGFAKLDPLQVWYARVDADDLLAALPARARKAVRKRITKATAHAGSELDYPKLAGTVSGQIRINEQPPLIFHPQVARAHTFRETLQRVFDDYRETLAEDRHALLDRYRIVDAAIKVVGVGSVGRRCWIALLMSEDNTPLFLQFKEAVASVLEPYAGKSAYGHHGKRVVIGQRLMQPVSDIFLGWVTAPNGVQFYVRQLRDAKIKPLVERFDADTLELYAIACGWVLARAHAKVADVTALAAYLGATDELDEAVGDFAVAYADQAERDHAALQSAVRAGKIDAYREGN